MSTLHIEYLVPVIVTVDTDTRRVTRVNVADEELGEVQRVYQWQYKGNSSVDHNLAPTHPEYKEALHIADHDNDGWPAWEFGW